MGLPSLGDRVGRGRLISNRIITAERRPFEEADWITVGTRRVRLHVVRNLRARRYLLRLRKDGSARVTIPRRGSMAEAMGFVEKSKQWLERQLLIHDTRPKGPQPWLVGTEILLRGQTVRIEMLEVDGERWIVFGAERIPFKGCDFDLRRTVETCLRSRATEELPRRVYELASIHHFAVTRVTVRNQKSRWGSCSARGVISLNWRLIQVPEFVRDYIVLHELAHLRHLNHSRQFWQEVARICPRFSEAEKWLKGRSDLLM